MIVLDTSAVLAFVFDEQGARMVQGHLGAANVCSVNVTEIIAKMIDRKWAVERAIATFEALGVEVTPYDRALSLRAGVMRKATKNQGLSLGDRACLSLAERERLPVLTADRAWADLGIGVDVRVIR
jgi:ribonuclease VapC